jgi:hypothetical protein
LSTGVYETYVSNGTTLDLLVAVNGEPVGTSRAGSVDLFHFGKTTDPSTITLTTATGRQLIDLTFQRSDIGIGAGGTGSVGKFVGQRVDLSCGRLDVSVGGIILGPGPDPNMTFAPGDCDP